MNTPNDDLRVTPATIVGSIMLLIGMVNLLFAYLGWYPININESQLTHFVTLCFVYGPVIYTYWHNNSWRKPALIGDKVKDAVKAMDDVDNLEIEIKS